VERQEDEREKFFDHTTGGVIVGDQSTLETEHDGGRRKDVRAQKVDPLLHRRSR